MEFSIKALSPEATKAGCIVLGVYSKNELSAPARRVDQSSRGALRSAPREARSMRLAAGVSSFPV